MRGDAYRVAKALTDGTPVNVDDALALRTVSAEYVKTVQALRDALGHIGVTETGGLNDEERRWLDLAFPAEPWSV